MSRVVVDGEEYSVTWEELAKMDAVASEKKMTREDAAREVLKIRKAPAGAGSTKK